MAGRRYIRGIGSAWFNHTQWLGDSVANGLDNTCTASVTTCLAASDRFGQIIAVRAPREIQLGLKLYW